MGYTRPKITNTHITEINKMIQENPDWHRSRISVELCKIWDWRTPAGFWKDISCRDLLRDLDKAKLIVLPPARHIGRIAGAGPEKIEFIEHCTNPIETDLQNLMPLSIEIAQTKHDVKLFKTYIAKYHYLGYARDVGENMKYIIRSRNGAFLACLLFGSAAWKCRDRDAYIGWSQEQRSTRLYMLTNNVRFLIPGFVRVPCLASHTLSLAARRISSDWEDKYGHPVQLLETFVDKRFRGTCYQSANWIRVGSTAGRGRNDRGHEKAIPEKDIYLLPLNRRWRQCLADK